MFEIFYRKYFFFEFSSENVLKTLLSGRETTRKIYWIVLKKYAFFGQKIEKIAEKKKLFEIFWEIKIFIFFEFLTENVFKTLLRGRETTRKKYRVAFEKYDFFGKSSKKSLKKKIVWSFLTKMKKSFFLNFPQKMSLKLF